MSPRPDPPRLRDDPTTGEPVRALLDAVRPPPPDAAQIVRMRAAVEARAARPASAAPGAAPRWFPRKLPVALGLAAALGGAAWTLRAPPAVPPRAPLAPPRPPDPPAPPQAPPFAAPPPPPLAAPPPAPPPPARSSARRHVERPAVAFAHAVAPPTPPPAGAADDHAAPVGGLPRAPEPPVCDDAAHFAGLRRARGLLSGAPDAAAALCEEDARRCPDGPLSEERERVWIEALVRAGRRDDAQARWRRFALAFPRSVHRERLRALLEGGAP